MINFNAEFGNSGQGNELHETPLYFSGSGHEQQPEGNPRPKSVYQCPMKCEGDKTYNAPGNCPVCNMHLEPVIEIHDR